jgi:hypothetical protein
MGDLIERLRLLPSDYGGPSYTWMVRERIEAADELARLRAEVEQARRTADHWKAEHIAGNAVIDELRRRIAEAERFDAAMLLALGIPVSQDDAFAAFALVRLDAEEGK